MRKAGFWLLFAAALLAAARFPARGTDLSGLQPAQLLLVTRQGGQVRTACNTGASGTGATLEQALDDMVRTAEGRLYLQTVDELVFVREAEDLVPQAARCARLRPGAGVCLASGEPEELSRALAYLRAHPGTVPLRVVRGVLLEGGAPALPVLAVQKERMELLFGLDG